MNMLELVAVGLTLLAVYLTTRQVIWCWPLSMVGAALYAVVFYEVQLYAEVGLQGLYVGLSAYGWWAWRSAGDRHGGLAVTVAPARLRTRLLIVGILCGGVLGMGLSRYTGASLPFMDSTLAAFSLVAQWMQTRKILEAWLLWFAVDVFYVGMFLYKGLYPTAGLYAAFLYLAMLGYIEWRRSMAAGQRVETGAAA